MGHFFFNIFLIPKLHLMRKLLLFLADSVIFLTGSCQHFRYTIYQVFILANRNDYVPTKTIIDIMAALDDARMPAYFTRIDTSTRPGVESWIYLGLEYGMVGGSGYQATISCHAEVEFLLAEAAAAAIGGDSLSTLLFWDATRSTESPSHAF